MHNFRTSPRGLIYFCLFLVLFGAAMKLDDQTGYLNVAWTISVWGGLFLGSLVLLGRLWASRSNPDGARRIVARGAYGLLPVKLRDWLFS
jgi:hypothetical protein